MITTEPKYKTIALDIASKIADNSYRVGTKLYARSVIANQYNASSETARRAILILADLNIVKPVKGSGVDVVSRDNACAFIQQYESAKTLEEKYLDIEQELGRGIELFEDNFKEIGELLKKMKQVKMATPLLPYQIEITDKCLYIGKTVSEINLWHHTSATLVAVKRDNELMISPGPYALLCEHDIFYFIGDDKSFARTHAYLHKK